MIEATPANRVVDVETPSTLPRGPADAKRKPQLAAMAAGRRNRPAEHAENYPHVVVVLGPKTRVIECADRIQWIIQHRTGSLKTPWAGRSFCRTKEALIRIAGSHPALEALPHRFPE
jgi:hypothetical protein